MSIRPLTPEQLIVELRKPHGLIVVDVWGPNCIPCRSVNLLLEKVMPSYPHITVVKLNAEMFQDCAHDLGVTNLPSLVAFRTNGDLPYKAVAGLLDGAKVRRFLDSLEA